MVGNLLLIPTCVGIGSLLGYDIRGATGALIGAGAAIGVVILIYAFTNRRNDAPHSTGTETSGARGNGRAR